MLLQENIPLAPFTTLKIGGPARYFAEAASEDDLIECLEAAKQRRLPVFILGGGTNLLVSDAGFEGLVVKVSLKGVERKTNGDAAVRVTAAAGEDWDAFVNAAVETGLSGIENLSGIPGLVGGTPVQNVGAYGQEVSESIISVRCIDRDTLRQVEFTNAECKFSYRTSIFNSTARDRYLVTSVTFELTRGGKPNLSYKDLAEHFRDGSPDLSSVRQAVIDIRRKKSMVIDPADLNSKSAGSFFKNPVLSLEEFGELKDRFGSVPSYEFGRAVKLPAAWLIEKAGFQKGFALGKAGISSNHTLALINRGGATAAEIVALKDMIASRISEMFGIDLVPEPVFVGF